MTRINSIILSGKPTTIPTAQVLVVGSRCEIKVAGHACYFVQYEPIGNPDTAIAVLSVVKPDLADKIRKASEAINKPLYADYFRDILLGFCLYRREFDIAKVDGVLVLSAFQVQHLAENAAYAFAYYLPNVQIIIADSRNSKEDLAELLGNEEDVYFIP